MRASWNVLRADREMLVLPVPSALSSLAPPTTAEWIVLGVALTFITVFFDVARICAADRTTA